MYLGKQVGGNQVRPVDAKLAVTVNLPTSGAQRLHQAQYTHPNIYTPMYMPQYKYTPIYMPQYIYPNVHALRNTPPNTRSNMHTPQNSMD